jgi:hypothetical protein
MEDLRKDYNVQKKKSSINLYNIWRSNKFLFRFIFITSFILIILNRPDLVGFYIGRWVNNLYTSFITQIDMSSNEWYLILITIFSATLIYKILTFNKKS